MAPQYNRYVIGDNATIYPVLCNGGVARTVRIETYADGYHAFLIKPDGTYTNHTGYATVRKAINAAAKW